MFYIANQTPLPLKDSMFTSETHQLFEVDDGRCAKIFTPEARSSSSIAKLEKMLSIEINMPNVCWPQELIFDANEEVVGYLMTRPKGHPLSSILDVETRERLFPAWNRVNLCELSLSILRDVNDLQLEDILIGDLNADKIWVYNHEEIFFVDTDTYQFDAFLNPQRSLSYLPASLDRVDLSTTPRNTEHEGFSIAVLLFRILMAGKDPFTVVQATDGTIKRGPFPYPLAIESQGKYADDFYYPLWISMYSELRTLFFNTFTKGVVPELIAWGATLYTFLEKLHSNTFTKSLDLEALQSKRMQTERAEKIDDGRRSGTGDPKNIWGDDETPLKLGVLEISTRACKGLVADVRNLRNGFSWTACDNRSFMTELGQLMNIDKEIPWEDFERQALPEIRKGLDFLKKHDVDIFHCVATAALRGAKNRDFILSKLKELLDLNVQILDRNDEADATFSGFRWNLPQNVNLTGFTVLMDQGGGSTELSTFERTDSGLMRRKVFTDDDNKHLPTNIPVGTTSAVNNFLNQSQYDTDMQAALEDSQKLNRDHVNRATRPMQNTDYTYLVGVGSAITKATNRNSNKKQHGIVLTYEQLFEQQQNLADGLAADFPTVGELKDHFARYADDTNIHKKTRERLVKFFGLRMVLQVMDRVGIRTMIVNGMGLRYGIYHQMLNTIYPEIRSNAYNERFLAKSVTVEGVTEHTFVDGIINNIADYGMFIRLPNGDSGLLHQSKYRDRDDLIFESGKPLLVYVDSIKRDNRRGGWKYDLSLPPSSEMQATEGFVAKAVTKPKKSVAVTQKQGVKPRIRRRKP